MFEYTLGQLKGVVLSLTRGQRNAPEVARTASLSMSCTAAEDRQAVIQAGMPRPFRSGCSASSCRPRAGRQELREIETLGYSSVYFPDHFGTQWDPLDRCHGRGRRHHAAACRHARVRRRLSPPGRAREERRDDPARFRRTARARGRRGLDAKRLRSGGHGVRLAGVRIERLEEALQILKRMWKDEETSFQGKHYRITKIAKAIDPLPQPRRRIIVGGGRPEDPRGRRPPRRTSWASIRRSTRAASRRIPRAT